MSEIVEKGSSLDHQEDITVVAQKGHVATDKYGRPLVEIDKAVERRLRWKCDLFLIPPVALMYLFCFIDRANIGNARLAGLERDLRLAGYDYNLLLTSFYVAYVVFEIPSTLLCKKIGPGLYLPILTLLFGMLSFATAYVHSFGAAVAVRFLLGAAEAGVLPSFAYFLARWYTGDELAFRLSLYIVCAPLAGAFGGLLASAILKLDSVAPGIATWRSIFWIEGIITMGIAAICFFLVPDRPEKARWLTAEEKLLAETRIKVENVGSLEVLDELKAKTVLSGIFNVPSLTIALIFLFDNITVQGYAFFLPTIIRTLYPRTSTIQQQLRTVPPYVVGAFMTLAIPWLSWQTKRRGIWMVVSAPLVMIGFAMFVGSTNATVRYAGTFLVASGAFSFGALCNAWASNNVTSDTARAGAIGVVVMFGNLGGLISTWSYLPSDAPSYYKGNGLNLATSTLMLLLSVGLLVWMRWHNARKDRGLFDHYLEGKTAEEAASLNQNHPAFRMRY